MISHSSTLMEGKSATIIHLSPVINYIKYLKVETIEKVFDFYKSENILEIEEC